ncbi:Methionine aminopeptidase 1 [Sedimentisphaera cyanobacteriorum]|uniref:Methionine aminopeptidase n=1 Tax=Sedimentisphaera cyanobacteriorum TaxID=1940790 RepID=A0A1Q2HPW6_9BACT|nr:type I methionyl aminopeptidase [Sedimentisphaera cyanobacteriorum]AQQ09410.1 Methionine aminopeptidase 1 [Sedimentisphaera cyanobacteriorum]
MGFSIKTESDIEKMRVSGGIVRKALESVRNICRPGVTTAELDQAATEVAEQAGAATLFKGQKSPHTPKPFPGAVCASVNEQVVHGIPSSRVKLAEGDIVSVDFGVKLDGYCGDSAVTIPVGEISALKRRLMDVTKAVLDIAIDNMAPGKKWSGIAAQMQAKAKSEGFSVVKELVGHGIGKEMHESPQVPNFVDRFTLNNDFTLREGMVIAVEPMINAGRGAVKTLRDGWTVVTRDGRPSAHFEHTIAVTASGCEVLTG